MALDLNNNPEGAARLYALVGYDFNRIQATLIEEGIDSDEAHRITTMATNDAAVVEQHQQEIIDQDRRAIDQERT